jgi:NAD(P)-dependent dehydrogenase (short-subunit alcohol dehydrogenase family)
MSTLLIVGAGPRLGGAIARRFGRDGYDIALLSDTEESVEKLGRALQDEGITAGWAVADVADAAATHAAITRFAEHTGGIDVALHNISVWRDASVLDLRPEQLLADVAAGAAALLTIAQAVVPGMIAAGGGTILATGSAAADSPSPGAPTLGVQKASLRSLIQAMALELEPQGVHCATVTIYGVLAEGTAFDPARIADVYAEVVAEPRESWRTVIPYNG